MNFELCRYRASKTPSFCLRFLCARYSLPLQLVLAGSPSRSGDVMVDVKDVNQPSLPTPFHSVPVSISVLWPFQLYFSA